MKNFIRKWSDPSFIVAMAFIAATSFSFLSVAKAALKLF